MSIGNLLAQIPIKRWNRIVEEEPEWRYMRGFLEKYGFGKFAVLMVAAGLNDFQLKGKAEIAYWPGLRELLEEKEVPASPKEMREILREFYAKERLPDLKLKRLNCFLSSKLASELWNAEPKDIAENFIRIWDELAATMNQSRDAKTITFAMKCLGIALLMAGESNFSFESIPIPVDYRVREFTKRLGVAVRDDEDVRKFWNSVLENVKKNVKINMIHLDSLIWQIGVLSKPEIVKYFENLGLKDLGEKIAEMLVEMKLCVVPCGKEKIWSKNPNAGPTKAKDVYTGSFARTCIQYAQSFYPNSYVILSAKYGFLFPDEIVPGDYDVTFKNPRTNPIGIEELRRQAEEKCLMKYDEVVVVAGNDYAKIVKKVFERKRIRTPLVGLGKMGNMISEMKKAIKEGKEL